MLNDGQSYVGEYISSDADVFTLDDRAQLDELAAKFAPNGVGALKHSTSSLRDSLRKDPSARATIVSEWLAENSMPDDDEWNLLTSLRDKAHKAKAASMDAARYESLRSATANGFVTDENANGIIRDEQRRARHDAFKLANAIILEMVGVSRVIESTPEATMTAQDKAQVAQEFEEFEEWERAKDTFRARYKACGSITEKAALCAKFPELAKAAL